MYQSDETPVCCIGNAKSLGSDQYFGRDRVDDEEARYCTHTCTNPYLLCTHHCTHITILTTCRNRLDRLKHSNAISSDMFNGNADMEDHHRYTKGNNAGPSTEDLSQIAYDKLQHSVKNFFDDVRDRMN